jgi:hypothetical protein
MLEAMSFVYLTLLIFGGTLMARFFRRARRRPVRQRPYRPLLHGVCGQAGDAVLLTLGIADRPVSGT